MTRSGAVLLGSALVTACSLVTSFDGYQGSALVSGDAEAGITTSDATTNGDAASVVDAAGIDASFDAGPSVSFCQSLTARPTFCADFDTSADVSAGFTKAQISPSSGSGSQAIDNATFVSGPSSAKLSVNAGTGSGLLSILSYRLPGPPTKSIHLTFKVKLDATDPGGSLLLAQISVQEGSSAYYGLTLYQRSSGAAIQEQIIVDGGFPNFPEYPVGNGIQAGGGWADADMLLDYENQKMVVTFAGASLVRSLDPSGMPGPASIGVGVGYYGGGSVLASSAHFDNVVVNAK